MSIDAIRLLPLVALLLTSCASLNPTPSGEVSLIALEPADAERHTLEIDEDFQMGTPIAEDSRIMPTYPSEWLEAAPSRLEICVEITVDENGNVIASQPLRGSPDCAADNSTMNRAFDQAVERAVRTWRYTPSLLCRLAPNTDPEGSCDFATERTPISVLRAYRFIFEHHQGQPHVGVSETSGNKKPRN